MKIQKLITSYNLFRFTDEVNGYLEKGWIIIPETLSVYSRDGNDCCAVIIERDTNE